jgi:hypothetical protein
MSEEETKIEGAEEVEVTEETAAPEEVVAEETPAESTEEAAA